jgi:hypothetical protein
MPQSELKKWMRKMAMAKGAAKRRVERNGVRSEMGE